MTADSNLRGFLDGCVSLCGAQAIKTKAAEMEAYSVDWRKRYFGKPLAVIFPRNTQEVAGVVRLANQYRVALVPQGGNTGLSGGATPDDSGTQVILNLSKLKAVRAKDADNKTLTVECGVTLEEVQNLAREMGLFFPLSLGSQGSATIGGNLATNAGGTAVLRYGNARDLCLGVEVVTPTGEIWDGLRGLRKDNTGYDLKDLFIGSEGTLGLITAAVLKLFPKPKGVVTALLRVNGPRHAFGLLGIAQDICDATLTGFEYMTAESVRLVHEHMPDVARAGEQVIFSEGSLQNSVLIEISHPQSEEAATELLEAVVEKAMSEGFVSEAIVAQSVAQTKALWHLRDCITLAAAEDGPQVKLDIAVPVSRLVDFICEMDAQLHQNFPGVRITNFGHFGDGNLHYNIGAPKRLLEGHTTPSKNAHVTVAITRREIYATYIRDHENDIRRQVHDKVVGFNGSISAEHGLGVLRRDEAGRYKDAVELNLMRAVKKTFDPNLILNPEKVVRTQEGS